MNSYFTDIMDYKFTAGMEEKLDLIAEQKLIWNEVLKEFYTPFMEVVNSVMKNGQKVVIESDKLCPNCGKKMLHILMQWQRCYTMKLRI